MPLTAAQRSRLNTFLTALGTAVVSRETAYFNAKGRYCQLRRQTLNAINYDDKPTDQVDSWRTFGLARDSDLPDKTGVESMTVQVDIYDGPSGPGWQAVLSIAFSGKVYQRVFNRGPEPYREQDWLEVQTVV